MLVFLVGLAVLGGVTSQSLMDISTILILFFLIKDLIQKKSSAKDFYPIGIEWAFIGYFAVAIISLWINGKVPVPWVTYLSKFSWILNLYLFVWAFNRIEYNASKWLNYFNIAYIVPNIYAIITYFLGLDLLTNTPIKGTLGFVNSSTYHAHGNTLILVFFLSIYLFSLDKLSKFQKAATVFCLGLMGLSIFLTFTRGIWGSTFVSILILLLIYNKKLASYFVSAAVTLGMMALLFLPDIRDRILHSFTSHSDSVRADLLRVHFEMFKEHPFIGIGYWDSYRQISDYWPKLGIAPDYYESHAHNQLVNVLATTGLAGVLFFISMAFYFIKKSVVFMRAQLTHTQKGLAMACYIVLIDFALACLTDVSFEYAKIRGILIITLAAMLSFSRRWTAQ